MAEESIDQLVIPEKNELDDWIIMKRSACYSASPSNQFSTRAHTRLRSSTGSKLSGDSSLRHSLEKSDAANSDQTKVPHYLRASTGSCHDFCKYGIKHASEDKARKPLRKRTAKPLHDELSSVHIIISGEKKKEKVVKHKVSGNSSNHSPDLKYSPDIKSHSAEPEAFLDKEASLDEEEFLERRPSLHAKSHSADLNPSPDTESYCTKPDGSLVKEVVVENKPSMDTKSLEPKPSPDTKSYLPKSKTSLDAKTHSPKKDASSGNKTRLKKKTPPTKKFPSQDPPEVIKRVLVSSKQVEVPEEEGLLTQHKTSRTGKKTGYLSKEQSSPVKMKLAKVNPASSSDNSGGITGKGRRNNEAKLELKTTASKVSIKKALTTAAMTLSPKLASSKTLSFKARKAGNTKLVSPLKDQSRMRKAESKTSNNENVSEKTLYVINMESGNSIVENVTADDASQSLRSPSSPKSLSRAHSSSFSSYEQDDQGIVYAEDAISAKNKSLKAGKVQPVNEDPKKTLRKNKVAVSEYKSSSQVKLKFRSGKTVDLQSDNNGPRRLRFRRARIMGAEDGKGNLRRTFKKAGVNYETTSTVPSVEVVLKHQEVQSKKDAQGLLNNVIEETASKLVKSRKSKVKALVGAFETVISLHESKPASVAVS